MLLLFTRRSVWVPCIFAGLILFAVGPLAPLVERSVSSTEISLDEGAAFITPVPKGPRFPFHLQGATIGESASGPLILLEDGFPLGPGDTPHHVIRAKGNGLYSHWGRHLYFSSFDGTDPRNNGRAYSYRAHSALSPAARRVGLLLVTIGVLGFAAGTRRLRTAAAAQIVTRDRTTAVGWIVAAVGVAGLAGLAFTAVTSTPRQGMLDISLIKSGAPRGYVSLVAFGIHWPLRPAAANNAAPGSALMIYEDGKRIGQFDPDPRQVRHQGGGRFAFFGDRIAFSTPDGTDPRTNGRAYSWKLSVEVDPAAWAVLLAITVAGFVLICRASLLPWLGWLLGTSADRPGVALTRVRVSSIQALVVIGACAVGIYIVTFRWAQGHSSFLGFMGYMPLSDALGYFWCSVANGGLEALTSAQFPIDWCARRIFYPAELASYLGLTGWRPQLVLPIQAAVIGCSISVFACLVARYVGPLASIAAALGLFVFAYEFAIGNFMTEALGLPLGLFGLALLLAYAGGQRRSALLYWGLALFSIAMFARMGALLILPLLALWACLVVFRSGVNRRIIECFMVLGAIAAGPVLQVLVLVALGGDPANSGGNYATTLYGLSTGSRDWAQGYRDFPEFFLQSTSETAAFAKLQAAALANIRSNPGVFLHSLFLNMQAYATGAFKFGLLANVNGWLTIFWLVGIAWCVAHARKAVAALLLAITVGEIISVPLVFTGPSDHRVLTVSLGARLVLVGVGLTWLMSILLAAVGLIQRSSRAKLADAGADSAMDLSTKLALAVGVGAVVLTLLPATPATRLFALPVVTGVGCAQGQQEVVARVGRESMAVSIGHPLNPLNEHVLGIEEGQVEADPTRPGTWWWEHLPALQQGTTLIYAFQLMPGARGQIIPLVLDGQLPGDAATPLSFCYDPIPTSIQLADFKFRRVISVTAVSHAR